MTDHKPNKGKRSGVWAEIKTITEEHTKLSVVITERVRGRPAYSYQLCQRDAQGGNKFIQYPVRGLDKVPYEGETPPTAGDVIKALIEAAEAHIKDLEAKQPKKPSKPKGPKGDRKDKPRKERKGPGGLSALAKADAEKAGHEYKSKSQKRKEQKKAAKASNG